MDKTALLLGVSTGFVLGVPVAVWIAQVLYGLFRTSPAAIEVAHLEHAYRERMQALDREQADVLARMQALEGLLSQLKQLLDRRRAFGRDYRIPGTLTDNLVAELEDMTDA